MVRSKYLVLPLLELAALCVPHAAVATDTGQVTCSQPNYTGLAGYPGNLSLDCSGNLRVFLGAGSSSGGSAVTITQVPVNITDRSSTITLGGTAQQAIGANALRKAWCIQNPPTETENLTVRADTAATATKSTILVPGAQACNSSNGVINTGLISVFAATTGHAFSAWEAQ